MTRNKNESRVRQTGKAPTEKTIRSTSLSGDGHNIPAGKMIPAFRMQEKKFDMVVDGVPYSVRSIPFLFNEEIRFRICINGNAEHLFTWDPDAGIIRAIDDESSSIPSVVEEALSERLLANS